MTFRFLGLVPTIALLAAGPAMAQVSPNQATMGGGGQMAYPNSLPSGQVQIPAAVSRDTGNMAYPASPGGVTQTAPAGRDTGNMAYPTGLGSVPTAAPMRGRPGMRAAAPNAAPAPAPTAGGMAAAHALETAPGAAPVPYTDFATPGTAMRGHHGMTHRRMRAAKKAMPAAAAAPAK